jgi:hypothetical protein
LHSYESVAFSALLIQMQSSTNLASLVHSLQVTASGSSLDSVISPNTYVSTSAGPAAWESLMDNGSLQPNCNMEGFNVNPAGSNRIRIGIVTNNESDCSTPDSRLGVGGDGSNCTYSPGAAASGDVCGCGCDNGDEIAPTFAWVFVR